MCFPGVCIYLAYRSVMPPFNTLSLLLHNITWWASHSINPQTFPPSVWLCTHSLRLLCYCHWCKLEEILKAAKQQPKCPAERLMSHAETTLTHQPIAAVITSSATGVVQLGKVMMNWLRKVASPPTSAGDCRFKYLDCRSKQFAILIIITGCTLDCKILMPCGGQQERRRS